MTAIHLERIVPEQNCFRFYGISIEDNFFGDKSLVIRWGRIGCRGRQRIAASGSRERLHEKALALLREKSRKGYLEA